MRFFSNALRKNMGNRLKTISGLLLGITLCVSLGSSRSAAQTQPGTSAATVAAEQIEKLLKEADAYVQQQDLAAGYNLYLRILGLDPLNQAARENIYNIIKTQKTLGDTAQKQGSPEQAKLAVQKYQNLIRDLLKMLTMELKRWIQQYGELVALEKNGEDVKGKIIPVLQNVMQILTNLKTVYTDFPQGDAGAEKMVERIGQTLKKYEAELAFYQK